MKTFIPMILILMGLLFGFGGIQPPQAQAQVTINTTTLSTAIATPAPTVNNQTPSSNVTVASLGSGATAILANYILFMDGEAMQVRTVPTTGTTLQVNRAWGGTRAAPHAANVLIYYGPAQAFVSGNVGQYFYGGSCTASNFPYLPIIDIRNAMVGTCNSTTSLWNWFSLWPMTSQVRARQTVNDANYTATVFDEIIAYTAVTANRTVTLPSPTGLAGKIIIVKDESGSAAAAGKNIFVTSGTAIIDVSGNYSSAGVSVTSSIGGVRLYTNGTNWFSW